MSKLLVDSHSNHQRIESFLSSKIDSLSRRLAHKLCEQGLIFVNSKKITAGYKIKTGDIVTYPENIKNAEAQTTCALKAKPLNIVYEDSSMLVVDKPREIHCIRLSHNDDTTLADLIASYCPRCLDASRDRREAGLVQRLDFFTSGLIIAAKTKETWKDLHTMILCGEMHKEYLAIVEGKLSKPRITIDTPICQSSNKSKMQIAKQKSKQTIFPARSTVIEVQSFFYEEIGTTISLVQIKARRVYRHQIRLHLSSIGHPLVGDELYGSNAKLSESTQGFFLHAEKISIKHPESEKNLDFFSNGRLKAREIVPEA